MPYRKNSDVKVVLHYPDVSVHERILKANRSTITKLPQDVIAKYIPAWRYGPGFSPSEPGPGILYIASRSCDQESEKKVVDLLESRKDNWPQAVILDLRANPGGMTPLSLFRHLISAPAKWDVGTTRWSMSYMDAQTQGKSKAEKASWMKQHGLPSAFELGWCPLSVGTGQDISSAKVHYDGPLVVLTGPATGSAAEQLVVTLHQSGRAKLIGERTAGVGGQPMSWKLH